MQAILLLLIINREKLWLTARGRYNLTKLLGFLLLLLLCVELSLFINR